MDLALNNLQGLICHKNEPPKKTVGSTHGCGSALTSYAFVHSMILRPNWAIILPKTLCVKAESAVDHSTITRWFKKFLTGFKNVMSKIVLQAIKSNLVSSTQ